MLALPSADRSLGPAVEITTVEPNADIAVTVTPEPPADDARPPPTFRVDVTENGGSEPVESFPGLTLTKGDRNIETVVNKESTKVKVATKIDTSKLEADLASLPAGSFAIEPAPPTPVAVPGRAFAGSETARQGINGLVIADDVTMVMVPDLVTAATKEDGTVDLNLWKTVQLALINHCEGQANRMAVLDAPPGMTPQQIKEWRSDVAMYDSPFAALYYPWIEVGQPGGHQRRHRDHGPAERPHGRHLGPHRRHPRRVEGAGQRGRPRRARRRDEHHQGRAGPAEPDRHQLHPPVRHPRHPGVGRPHAVVEHRLDVHQRPPAVQHGRDRRSWTAPQCAVFEPNDKKLWEGLKRTIDAFLRGLWRDGALFGATAEQAFYVKCDEETNPPESIDQGKVVVEIGIAPGEAGRVRDLPHRPDQGDVGLRPA